MDQLPLVSVVMATYNGERFLRKQLDSILKQTYPIYEIIIVDDCSTDNTISILTQYAYNHDLIKIVSNEVNLGFIKNFEKGMILATGNLIALSDHDDIWYPEKINTLVEARGSHDVVYGNSRLIDENDKPLGLNYTDERVLKSFNSPLSFLIGNTVSGHAMLLTKDLFDRSRPFPPLIPHDHWLCFIATFTKSILYLPQVLVDYRQHPTNVYGMLPVINGYKRKIPREPKEEKFVKIRQRAQLLADKCPPELAREKRVLTLLNRTYRSFSLPNNFIRMLTFFQYRDELLATKKRTSLRKWLFCFKMFVKIK